MSRLGVVTRRGVRGHRGPKDCFGDGDMNRRGSFCDNTLKWKEAESSEISLVTIHTGRKRQRVER